MKPLCAAPFIGFFYKGSRREIRPCCESRWYDNNNEPPGLYGVDDNITWEEIWHSDKMKDIRKSLLNGEYHSACHYCKKLEDKNMPSTNIGNKVVYGARHFYNNIANNTIEPLFGELKYNVDTGTQFDAPFWLDVRFHNLCNLKCRMCNTSNSSEWAEEINDNLELYTTLSEITNNYINPHPWKDLYNKNKVDDIIIDKVPKDKLVKVKMLGGEPTIQKEVHELLKILQTSPNSNNINLNFTTNVTNVNRKFATLLNNFDVVHLQMSLDGIGKWHDYIRSPSKWKSIEKNIDFIMNKMDLPDTKEISFGMTFVIQMYNIFGFEDFLGMAINARRGPTKNKMNNILMTPCEQYYLDVAMLKDHHKEILLKRIEIFENKMELDNVEKELTTNKLKIMLSNWMNKDNKTVDEARSTFKRFTTVVDSVRETQLKDLDVNLKEYVE